MAHTNVSPPVSIAPGSAYDGAGRTGSPQDAAHENTGLRTPGSDVPPGWTYNPSAWPQRLPSIGIALLNGAIATYLAVCQIWFHGQAWDPLFGSGTQRVLTSSVSQAFPVSDAALGAVAYFLEAGSGILGDARRWRTKPWLTLSFGLLVLPLCLTSIILMIMQPVVVHAWCSLCLLILIGMLLMVPLALDEVIASLQFLYQAYHEGQSLWQVFTQGGDLRGQSDGPAPAAHKATTLTGYVPPVSLLVCLAIGLGLLLLPAAQGDVWGAADSLYITGALVVVFSSLSFAEVARAARYPLMLCGAWLFAMSPLTMPGATNATKFLELFAGAALLVLSYPKGRIRERYGLWQRFIV